MTLPGGGDAVSTPVELELDVTPGTYVATAEDPESGETNRVEPLARHPVRVLSTASRPSFQP